MYGSPATSKDLNLFKHGKEEPDLHHPNHHYQQQQMSSGLLRYRSAPSSLLGEVCEDIHPHRSSDPEAETMLARFMSPDLRGQIGEKPSGVGVAAGQRSPQFIQAMGPESPEVAHQQNGGFSSSVTQMLYHSQQQQQQLPNHSSAAVAAVESSYEPYRVGSSMAMEQEQIKSAGNCSNLTRHSSSPAGFFSHLNAENGYAVMRGMGGFNPGVGSNGEAALGPSRLKNQISFSSRQGSVTGLMSQLSGIGSESLEDSSPEDSSGLGSANGSCRSYIPSFPVGGSWDYSPLLSDNFSGLKRSKDVEGKLVTGLNPSDAQNGEPRNHVPGLSHQFSLPKNSSEMAAMEKFLQFQDSVPCKIRAKRGCATHPRSIAERVRRTRISERMRKLQELVPNMDKQTNTADMLDLAVEHIKDLQKQVKNLMDSRANCTCSSSKVKPYPSPAV